MQRAIVIGAGFGGMAAALRLRRRGYHVTLIEQMNQLGGRAAVTQRGGYTFDMGPTVITAKFLFDELFELFGKRREDYVKFVDLYPWYRVQFADGTFFDYGGTIEQMLEQIRKFSPGDADGYLKFLEHSKRIFDVGFVKLGDKPFHHFGAMLAAAPDMIRLGAWRTVWGLASKYIKNEKLRRVFSFQPLLVGGNPFNTTSIYSLIHYLERQWGVQFAMGGTGAIVAAMGKLMQEEGIEIRLNAAVEQIVISKNSGCHPERTREGSGPESSSQILREYPQDDKPVNKVSGVRLAGGRRIECRCCRLQRRCALRMDKSDRSRIPHQKIARLDTATQILDGPFRPLFRHDQKNIPTSSITRSFSASNMKSCCTRCSI